MNIKIKAKKALKYLEACHKMRAFNSGVEKDLFNDVRKYGFKVKEKALADFADWRWIS